MTMHLFVTLNELARRNNENVHVRKQNLYKSHLNDMRNTWLKAIYTD